MSAVAVSPVRRESCDQGAEPPSPLRREALIYCPRGGRGERTGSRRSPGPRGRGARRRLEVRRAEKPGESAPGSRRGSAGGTERGGRRRVPAHPAARAPPKAGAPRPLPQSWGRQKSPGNGGKKQEKGGTRARGPPHTKKTPGSCAVPFASARPEHGRDTRPPLPCGVPGGLALPAPTPPRSPRSRPPVGSPRPFLCVRGIHDAPAPVQGQWRGPSLSQLPPPPHPVGTQPPEECRKGPRAPYRDWRARVSSRRGTAPVWGPWNSS